MEKVKFRLPHYYLKTDKFSYFSYWGRINHRGEFRPDTFSSPAQSNITYVKTDEQFTGLKDRNGEDDYEGNLLQDELTGLICQVKYGQYAGRCGTGCGFYLEKLTGEVYVPYPYTLDGWEIIGSIHKNDMLSEEVKL